LLHLKAEFLSVKAVDFTKCEKNDEEILNTSIISLSSESAIDNNKNIIFPYNPNFNYVSELNEYIPCMHSGICTLESCSCIQKRGCCEKFCFCFSSCNFTHRGCDCQNKCKKSCPCKAYKRECDPDICHRDQSHFNEEINTTNIYINGNKNFKFLEKIDDLYLNVNLSYCNNINIFFNKSKKTNLSKSIIVDGYGLFAKEEIKVDEFICEYKGELITKEETDRRSLFNDHFGLNYFFRLNDSFDIDAYTLGNKMR